MKAWVGTLHFVGENSAVTKQQCLDALASANRRLDRVINRELDSAVRNRSTEVAAMISALDHPAGANALGGTRGRAAEIREVVANAAPALASGHPSAGILATGFRRGATAEELAGDGDSTELLREWARGIDPDVMAAWDARTHPGTVLDAALDRRFDLVTTMVDIGAGRELESWQQKLVDQVLAVEAGVGVSASNGQGI